MDSSCYDVLRKMSLEYLMRYPLVIGQGQLGSQESNELFSSSRYSEAKPSIYTDLMFNDFKKNTVPLKETYNGEYFEPVYLPSVFPNALCNGRQAIAIGLAHNSVCHNLTEVCNAAIAAINKGEQLTIDELMEYIKGPDFPLGNVVINSKDIRQAFLTGKSNISLKIRGDYEIKGQDIIFNTIPYRTYRDKIKEQIQKNIDELDKVLDDFNDESNLGKNKLIFTVKKGIDPNKVLNLLFSCTDLQTTLSYNMTYIVNGTPRLVSMMELLDIYVQHQEHMLINATNFDKEKAEARAHILRGLIAAVDKINEVIEIIKNATNKDQAKTSLISFLLIDEVQAKAILEMRLGSLTRIDKDELIQELQEKEKFIAECIEILTLKEKRNKILIERITDLRDKYGDERRTQLLNIEIQKETKEEEVIEPMDCIVTIDKFGIMSRQLTADMKKQKRAGVGNKNKSNLIFSCSTNTLDDLLIFTNKGRMFKIKVNDIAETATNFSSLCDFEDNEIPLSFACGDAQDNDSEFIVFATKNGLIKKTPLEEYKQMKKGKGIKAINLKENDTVAAITFLKNEKNNDIILCSKNGYVIRFAASEIPTTSRNSQGVIGMKLSEGNTITQCIAVPYDSEEEVSVITKNGEGKRVKLAEITKQKRAGKGVNFNKGNSIVGFVYTSDKDELLISGDYSTIRIAANELPLTSKQAKGVVVIKNNSSVKSVCKIRLKENL